MSMRNRLIEFFVRRSAKEHSPAVQTIATLAGGTFFAAGWPALVYLCGICFDKTLMSPRWLSVSASIICFAIGIPWLISSIMWQLVFGKGTPVPVVPTKHFLQNGPYRYVRNPMILGFSLYLLGWAFLFNKAGAFLAAAAVIAFLLAEVKIIEESELEKRFGDAYRQYKKEIPFIFPKWRKKKCN